MNFTQENNVQVSLPQFSEITSRPSQISNLRFTASQSQTNQNVIYTTATASTQTKQLLVSFYLFVYRFAKSNKSLIYNNNVVFVIHLLR